MTRKNHCSYVTRDNLQVQDSERKSILTWTKICYPKHSSLGVHQRTLLTRRNVYPTMVRRWSKGKEKERTYSYITGLNIVGITLVYLFQLYKVSRTGTVAYRRLRCDRWRWQKEVLKNIWFFFKKRDTVDSTVHKTMIID